MRKSYQKDALLAKAREHELRAVNAHALAAERFNDARQCDDPAVRLIALSVGHIARLDAAHEERKADLYRAAVREAEAASIDWQKRAC